MALRRLATVIERSDWPSRLTRNCRACQVAVFGAARLRLLIPENSTHGPAARSRAPLGQDLTCFSNLLYDGPLRRVPRANKTFHELDQIEKLRCHDTQENEADKRLVESETYLAAIKLADLNPICEAINSPAMARVPLPRARHALAYNLPPVAGSPRAASSR